MACCSPKCKSDARLDDKTAVITGCNTGIGKETAKDLYKRGCRVIMACRDVSKAEDAAKEIRRETSGVAGVGTVVVVRLDLSSFASVRQCAAELLRTEPQINLLINNAGLGVMPRAISQDGYEMIFAVNHLGHFLFTLLLLPRLLTSTPARIVNVSSVLHMFGSIDFKDINMEKSYSTASAYNRSKLANVLFSHELSNRLKNRGVTTYSLHPGGVDTEINRNMDSAVCPGSEWIFKNVISLCNKTPLQGAQTTIYCAVDEKLAEFSGQYYSDCKRTNASSKARDSKLALKLWDESLKMVDLESFDPFTPLPFKLPETPVILIQPASSSAIHIPVQSTSVEKPVSASSEEKPVSDVEKPIQVSAAEIPVQASSVEKPVQAPDVEKPVQASSLEKSVEKPVQASSLEKPVSDVEEPVQVSAAEIPVQASSVEKPVQSPDVEKPVQASSVEKPASDVEKPVQASSVEKIVEKPVQASSVEKPVQVSAAEKPVDSIIVDKPEEMLEMETHTLVVTTAIVESQPVAV